MPGDADVFDLGVDLIGEGQLPFIQYQGNEIMDQIGEVAAVFSLDFLCQARFGDQFLVAKLAQ